MGRPNMVWGSPAATLVFLLVFIQRRMVLQHVIAVVIKLLHGLEPENWNPWRVTATMLIYYIVICSIYAAIDLLQSLLYLVVRLLPLFLLFTFFDPYGRTCSARSFFGSIATTTYLCEECRLAIC